MKNKLFRYIAFVCVAIICLTAVVSCKDSQEDKLKDFFEDDLKQSFRIEIEYESLLNDYFSVKPSNYVNYPGDEVTLSIESDYGFIVFSQITIDGERFENINARNYSFIMPDVNCYVTVTIDILQSDEYLEDDGMYLTEVNSLPTADGEDLKMLVSFGEKTVSGSAYVSGNLVKMHDLKVFSMNESVIPDEAIYKVTPNYGGSSFYQAVSANISIKTDMISSGVCPIVLIDTDNKRGIVYTVTVP